MSHLGHLCHCAWYYICQCLHMSSLLGHILPVGRPFLFTSSLPSDLINYMLKEIT